jgi:Cys-tRNA(Pro)/Cys-tRNA(Cys) deacylase
MARTRGIQALERAGVEHRLLEYAYQGGAVAEHAAAALGVEPERLLKSLVATAGETPVFALVPASAELSLRKLAAAAGARSARMATPADAERLTGYRVGGISPLGSRRALPVYVEATAQRFERVCLNAGGRGAIVELETTSLLELTGARLADIVT